MRLAAGLVDLLAGQALFFLAIAINGMWAGMLDVPLPRNRLGPWLNLGVMWLYFAVFESSARRATPGKMLFRLVVTDTSGRRLTFLRAAIRFVFKLVSACSLAGVLAIPFNRRRRGLHDVLAGTIVAERGAGPALEPAGPLAAGGEGGVRRRGSLLRWVAAVAALVVAGLILLWQYAAWDMDRNAQSACLRSLKEDMAKAQAASRKWSQFEEEVARLDTERQKLELMLPARLDVEAFRRALDRELASNGLEAEILSVQTFRRGKLFRAELRMTVAGDPASIADLLGRGECAGRLTTWNGSFTSEGVGGALSIFASPAPLRQQSACSSRRGDVWLWPFSARAARLAAEVERAQADLAPLKDASEAVHRYELSKQDLQNRIVFVNKLHRAGSGSGSAETEPEIPVEEKPQGVRS